MSPKRTTAKGKQQKPGAHFASSKLQHAFKHTGDFGVTGTWSDENGVNFEMNLVNFIASAPIKKAGTYRGIEPVMHHFNSATKQWVALDPSGNLVACWKVSPTQEVGLITKGNVQ